MQLNLTLAKHYLVANTFISSNVVAKWMITNKFFLGENKG